VTQNWQRIVLFGIQPPAGRRIPCRRDPSRLGGIQDEWLVTNLELRWCRPRAQPIDRLGAAPDPMADKARIFLVEDHAGTARALRIYLENHDYQVSVADSVASALAHAEHEPFDLLLCDIGLPDGTGWDLMKILSANRSVRGIAFTASGSPEDIERSRKVGFMKHVMKGSSAEDLVSAIEDALKSKPDGSAERPPPSLRPRGLKKRSASGDDP
jgi:CheY-like chemotaxis protein